MLTPDRLLILLLCLLAGCATDSKTRSTVSEPEEPPMEAEHVAESPAIAAPRPTPERRPAPPRAPDAPATNMVSAGAWISLEAWSQENKAVLRPSQAPPNRAYSLVTSNGLFALNVNSLVAKWEGTEFRLGFEPQILNDQLFIHELDLKKNIEPLLQNQAIPASTNRVVVIDPGHGGGNGGTRSVLDGANEKEFTLDWALRIAPLLSSNGWTVVLTRTNDVELPLSSRIAIADFHKADLFISLHFNSAAPSREQNGLETFCLTPSGMRSTLVREYEDNPSLVFTNNAFDAENLRYAMRIHRQLLTECSLADRGVRRARFLGVLRGQNRPAVLLEGGYLSNPNEAGQIATPEFRQKLAAAVAQALQ